MNQIRQVLAMALTAAMLWTGAQTPQAQDEEEGASRNARRKYSSIPYSRRKEIQDYQLLKESRKIKTTRYEATGWLSPSGERLVGIVDGRRMLTKPQLDLRVNLLLQQKPPLNDPIKEQDRRIAYESNILADWAQLTTLAVYAEKEGFAVTPQEMDQTLQQLSAQNVQYNAKAAEKMRLIGIPEADLRQELHDGLVIEKLLRARVALIPDGDLQQIFARETNAFLQPTRVKAWQIFQPMVGSPTREERAATQKNMEKFAKKLRKCKSQEDYLALQKEMSGRRTPDGERAMVLSCLNGISDDEPLPKPVMDELFGLSPGDASKVIASKLGLHVVKVVERIAGHRGAFEEAKPQIQNYLMEKMKDVLYEGLTQRIKVYTDAGGLNKYREIGAAGSTETTATQGAAGEAGTGAEVADTDAKKTGTGAGLTAPPRPRSTAQPLGQTGRFAGDPPPVEVVVGAKAEPVTVAPRKAEQPKGQRLHGPAVNPPAAPDEKAPRQSALDRPTGQNQLSPRPRPSSRSESVDSSTSLGDIPMPPMDAPTSGSLMGADPRALGSVRPGNSLQTPRNRALRQRPRQRAAGKRNSLLADPPAVENALRRRAQEENPR